MKLMIAGVCLLLVGCITGTIDNPVLNKKGEPVLDANGNIASCKGHYYSFWKDIDAASLAACGATGDAANSKVSPIIGQLLLKGLEATLSATSPVQ